MDVSCTSVWPIFLYGCGTSTSTEVQMGRLEVTHSNCLRRVVGVKLTDRHRLATIREQCGTSSMFCRWTFQWMGHILRMDGEQTRSVAEDGRIETLKLRQGHRNVKGFYGMDSSAIRRCHEEGCKIQAEAAERALDGQASREAIEVASLNLKRPNSLDPESAVDSGLLYGALCNDSDLVAEDVQVTRYGEASATGQPIPCVCVDPCSCIFPALSLSGCRGAVNPQVRKRLDKGTRDFVNEWDSWMGGWMHGLMEGWMHG
eukprot:364999-Chlamydomonas_euryale.AAC.19